MKILLILFITLISQANECFFSLSDGTKISTMSKTYKEIDNEKRMWFKIEKSVDNEIVERAKNHVAVLNNKFKNIYYIEYDKNGDINKSSVENDKHKDYEEPIPESTAEWMVQMINAWENIEIYDGCDVIAAIGDIKMRHPNFDIKRVHSYLKELHKNDPVLAEEMNNPDNWEKIWKEQFKNNHQPEVSK